MKASRGRNFTKRDSRSTQRVYDQGLSKLVAFGIKRENKLLGQGDAVEHQFHAWARGRETPACALANGTRWKLPVALPTSRRSLRSYWVLRETELLAAMERPGLACITNATATMPGTGIDFRGLISRECSRIARRSGLSQNALGETRVASDGSDWGSARFIDPRAKDWISELLIMIDRFQQLRLCQNTYERMTESSFCVCMYARFNNLCYAKILLQVVG